MMPPLNSSDMRSIRRSHRFYRPSKRHESASSSSACRSHRSGLFPTRMPSRRLLDGLAGRFEMLDFDLRWNLQQERIRPLQSVETAPQSLLVDSEREIPD